MLPMLGGNDISKNVLPMLGGDATFSSLGFSSRTCAHFCKFGWPRQFKELMEFQFSYIFPMKFNHFFYATILCLYSKMFFLHTSLTGSTFSCLGPWPLRGENELTWDNRTVSWQCYAHLFAHVWDGKPICSCIIFLKNAISCFAQVIRDQNGLPVLDVCKKLRVAFS